MKPHIRKMRASVPGAMFECVSVHCGKGHAGSRRFGYGATIPQAYESWKSGRVPVETWA